MKNVTGFFLSCLLALFQFNGAAFAQVPVTLRFAEIHEPAYPTTVGDYQIAKLVKERTHGRVIIEVYDSMKLGDEAAVIKKVQDGDIDLTRINIGPVTRYVPLLNAFLMPYIFRDVPHMLKVVNGPIGNDVLSSADKNDFIGFGWFDGGTRNFYTKTPVKSPSDLKGLRIRTLQNDLMVSIDGREPDLRQAAERCSRSDQEDQRTQVNPQARDVEVFLSFGPEVAVAKYQQACFVRETR